MKPLLWSCSYFWLFLLMGCGELTVSVNDNKSSDLGSSLALSIEDNDISSSSPALSGDPTCNGGASFLQSSAKEMNGEYLFTVSVDKINCIYSFSVNGAGGGRAYNTSSGGNGGKNSFLFQPGQAGVFRIVVGGGGTLALGH